MFDTFCSFCEHIYGGSHSTKEDSLNYKILYITNNHDHFKINLTDKIRFGKYDLYHRNWGEKLGGGYNWHKQGTYYDIGYALFLAYNHSFNKQFNLPARAIDYEKFLIDYKKYICNNLKNNI